MPVPSVTTSAAGSLTLLEDEDTDVRVYALTHLLAIVPQFWAEISDRIAYLEELADATYKGLPAESRPLANLLISKTYFYMGVLEEAVEFALKAEGAFEKEPAGEFKETIIAGCLDRAIAETNAGQPLDRGLAAIVDGVLHSSTGENGKLAIGLALSLHRLDLIEMIFRSSTAPAGPSSKTSGSEHDESLLRYILAEVVSGAGGNETWTHEFRLDLFSKLLALFLINPHPDWNSITAIWVQKNDYPACGEALIKLLEEKEYLEAYQIGFDLSEVATQGFVESVRNILTEKAQGPAEDLDAENPRNTLDEILRGVKSAELFLNFLHKNNKTDMSILKVTKDSLEDRYSIYHSAITFTNAFAHCGTTSDKFLRENLDWLGRANNWAKFSTTAALGLIHRGSLVNGIRVVRPYLPGGSAPSKFSEGGALFALGLIYAGRKEGAQEELRRSLAEGNDPIVQHGAALGLGVSGIATADEDICEEIKTALYQDNATAGEAAGYAMGLVMLGTASEKVLEEMLTYARETQHEKIIRSLAMGVAFLMYEQREGADQVIKTLCEEKDSIMRYGGMFTIALAYAGTGSNKAVRRLLHVAVSDVNDDVRRAAVTALGFVLFRNHTQVPRVVQLLAESYNPHVRHGATLALGISCAGTGLEAAIDLLEPLTKDPVDFVRQGAYISLAMILIQQSEAQSPKVTSTRELFTKVVSDKHEDPMARFGASLAQGIIDAGGRNMTLSLSTRAGTLNMQAIVGMALFVQFWYWFPLAHGLGLAFSPTAVIGLDEKLRVPDIELECAARPSLFAYPSTGKKVEKKKEEKAKTAVLSTTAKARAREKTKKEEKGEAMETDDTKPEDAKEDRSRTSTPVPAKSRKPTEPSSFTLTNMSRVTPQQLAFVSFPTGGRYEPIRSLGSEVASPSDSTASRTTKRPSSSSGESKKAPNAGTVIMLRDLKPDEDKEDAYIELDKALWRPPPPPEPEAATTADTPSAQPAVAGAGAGAEAGAEEEDADAPIPAPFEYDFE
ncbi:endopeptidase [Naematelia encephala]|uniref:26S proteasome regulatory subunit RPN2 n=1 Tax=Naematelia encephala TaxID=71784 RepID=A0A1Y2B0A5_9TREE|nr:endopeptidase [Naematelia encephala]